MRSALLNVSESCHPELNVQTKGIDTIPMKIGGNGSYGGPDINSIRNISPETAQPQKSNQDPNSSLRDVPFLVMPSPVKIEHFKSTLGRRQPRVNASLHGLVTFLETKAPTFFELFGVPTCNVTVSVGFGKAPTP